jgi:hypothetical protein
MPRRPQRPTKAAHSKIPSSRLRLARGCAPPSGGLRPVRGGAFTSSGLRLARGSALPSNGVRLARGRSARARLLPYAGIQCPNNGGAAPSCAWGSRPGASHQLPRREPIPATVGGLCNGAGASPVTLRRLLWYG